MANGTIYTDPDGNRVTVGAFVGVPGVTVGADDVLAAGAARVGRFSTAGAAVAEEIWVNSAGTLLVVVAVVAGVVVAVAVVANGVEAPVVVVDNAAMMAERSPLPPLAVAVASAAFCTNPPK